MKTDQTAKHWYGWAVSAPHFGSPDYWFKCGVLKAGRFLRISGTSLHRALHIQLPIVLIWLKYWRKTYKTAQSSSPSVHYMDGHTNLKAYMFFFFLVFLCPGSHEPRHQKTCSAKEASQSLGNANIATINIMLPSPVGTQCTLCFRMMQFCCYLSYMLPSWQTTKVLIRLRMRSLICTFVVRIGHNRFSHSAAQTESAIYMLFIPDKVN